MSGKKSIDFRKVLCVVFLFAVLISFAVPVMAADTKLVDSGGVNGVITEPEWLVKVLSFFGFGTTWADMIVSLAVLVLIFAAAFDVLTFTAFETKWVKYVISVAIALVASVSGATQAVGAFALRVAGGGVALATTIVIIVAVIFFVIGSFFKGKIMGAKYKAKSEEVKGLMDVAAQASVGRIKEAKAVFNATKGSS